MFAICPNATAIQRALTGLATDVMTRPTGREYACAEPVGDRSWRALASGRIDQAASIYEEVC